MNICISSETSKDEENFAGVSIHMCDSSYIFIRFQYGKELFKGNDSSNKEPKIKIYCSNSGDSLC